MLISNVLNKKINLLHVLALCLNKKRNCVRRKTKKYEYRKSVSEALGENLGLKTTYYVKGESFQLK